MTEIKIEKNVPVPVGRLKYPWDAMKPGDSFLTNGRSQLNPPQHLVDQGWRFTQRRTNNGLRIWRVK